MARKFFQRFMPSHERLHSERALRLLRPLLNKPYLWHLNRHTAATGIGWGCFWSMLPVLGQSIPAVFTTARFRGNIPLAIVATWLSNPFTLIPHWWSAYLIGRFVLRMPRTKIQFTWEYLYPKVNGIGKFLSFMKDNFWDFYVPLFVGSAIEGIILGIGSYYFVKSFWRWHTQRRWAKSRVRARKLTPISV